jgi:L-alanine-DL-glutamate epimerase-like enolase superfamily enzyme
MKLARCDVYRVLIPLVGPFVIASATQRAYEGVLLRLRTTDGLEGWGEAAPSPIVTGETPDGVAGELWAAQKKLLALDPLEMERSIATAQKHICGSSALAAVDIALHDLKGQYYAVPLHHLLGGFRSEIETSMTISIREEQETLRQAEELVRKGFRILKLKLGSDPDKDIVRVRLVRSCLGSRVRLRLDANQGYTVADALRVLRSVYGCDVEFCEQPVRMDDLRGLARVTKGSPVPVMADESVRGPRELLKIIQMKAASMVNLKLMKAGGLQRAMQMASIAEAAGMPCQMGCMIETRIGVTAATHLALALQNIRYADLDGHLHLASDPCQGGVFTSAGQNRLAPGAGLGLAVSAPPGTNGGRRP